MHFTLRRYCFLSILLHPIVFLLLQVRKYQKKEEEGRIKERFGICSVIPPEGKRIVWVHAASVGESMSVLPFIEALCKHYTDVFVVLTTGTVTSANIIAKRLPERAVHQYVPVDTVPAVSRFIANWQPCVGFLTESELWPCLLDRMSKQCPLILLNARMSEKTYELWRRRHILAKEILECFSAVFTQEARYVQWYKTLGAHDVRYIGNLKYDAPPLPDLPSETGALLEAIGDRPLWLAASLHPGDEHAVFETHRVLKEEFPDILTIMVPRHVENGALLEKIARDKGYHCEMRSKGQVLTDLTDIYIADTMGEMGVFYRIAPVAFIGGSFAKVGGHNPLEAARLGCAVFFGPHTENFSLITEEILREKAGIQVKNAEDCAACALHLLKDSREQERLASQAKKLADSKNNIIQYHLDLCSVYLTTEI